LKHTFWFIQRKHFLPTSKTGIITKKGAAVIEDKDSRLRDDLPIPRFQELRDRGLVDKREIHLSDVLSGALRRSHAVVSHRWEDKHHPDARGEQLRRIKRFLQRSPHIQYLWYDYMSIPQGKEGPLGRTKEEEAYYVESLKMSNMLYLGLTVFVIWDQQYSRRFWPCIESWLGLQEATPGGLRPAPVERSRIEIACIGADQGSSNTLAMIRATWGSLGVAEASEKLRHTDMLVTHRRDKDIALHMLHLLDQQFAELYERFVGDSLAPTLTTPPGIGEDGEGAQRLQDQDLIRPPPTSADALQLVLAVQRAAPCQCARQYCKNMEDLDPAAHEALLGAAGMRASFSCLGLLPPPACSHCDLSCDCLWKAPILHLVHARADVNGRTQRGITPLFVTARQGLLKVARLLLSLKADVGASADLEGRTPLHEAARRGRGRLCQLFLEASAGPEVNRPCVSGSTPLLDAAAGGFADIVRDLARYRADVDCQLQDGTTALMHAARKGDVETCAALIDCGCQLCGGWAADYRGPAAHPCRKHCKVSWHLPLRNKTDESAVSIAHGRLREAERWSNVLTLLAQHGVK